MSTEQPQQLRSPMAPASGSGPVEELPRRHGGHVDPRGHRGAAGAAGRRAADHGLTPLTAGYLIGFAVVLVLLCGVQGRPWAIWVNLGIQVVLIAGWLVHGAVGFIGLIFTAVWIFIAYLRAEVLRRQKRGLLPGQQPPQA